MLRRSSLPRSCASTERYGSCVVYQTLAHPPAVLVTRKSVTDKWSTSNNVMAMNRVYATVDPTRAQIDTLDGPTVLGIWQPKVRIYAVLLNRCWPLPWPIIRAYAISRSPTASAHRWRARSA